MGRWAATANTMREMTRLHICLAVAFCPLRHAPCFCIFDPCLWGLMFLKISVSRLPDAHTHTHAHHMHTYHWSLRVKDASPTGAGEAGPGTQAHRQQDHISLFLALSVAFLLSLSLAQNPHGSLPTLWS